MSARRTRTKIAAIALLLAVAVPARAGLVDEALARNPEIRAARLSWKAAVEEIRVAGALPDPQVKYTGFPDPIETRLGPQDWNLTVSQKIPFFAKLTARQKLAAARAELARIRYDIKVRDTVAALRKAVSRLAYLRRAARLAKDNRELLGNAALALSDPGKDGPVSLDLMRAASQKAQADYDLTLLEEKAAAVTAGINAILARPADRPIKEPLELAAPVPPAISLQQLNKRILGRLEEIRAAETEERIAAIRRKIAKLSLFPDMSLGLFYAGIGEPDVASPPPDAGRDALGISAGLTIPLWPGKDMGRLAETAAATDAARARTEALRRRTAARVTRLFYRLKNDLRLVELYRGTLVPQAISLLATSETEARNRVKSGADHLEALAALYHLRLSLARAESNYRQVLAELEALAGGPITGRKASGRRP